MTATLFTSGKFRAFDASGAPLIGGKVYSYQAGTNIMQPTYTDQSGAVPNANPVILDSTGSANIWLTGNYKIILQDAAGVQQWSTDNISDTLFNAAFTATSTTSLTIGIGAKTFVTQSGKSFSVGQYLIATETSDANSYYMIGTVTSYTGTSLVLNVTSISGSGTYSAWNISLSGPGASDATISISDITTNNATTLAHGFLPKLPGTSTTYLNGQGNYSAITFPVQPTYQFLTSSGTYTTPVNCKAIFVQAWGGGGGGGAAATNSGSAGGNTIFNSINATGGSGGQAGSGTAQGGAGGSAGSGTAGYRAQGASGGVTRAAGFPGGSTALGGGSPGMQPTTQPANSAANTGAGGTSASTGSTTSGAGSGGAGEYFELYIALPTATYSYTIGAAGAGGAAGTTAGGTGGSGFIRVTEYY